MFTKDLFYLKGAKILIKINFGAALVRDYNRVI